MTAEGVVGYSEDRPDIYISFLMSRWSEASYGDCNADRSMQELPTPVSRCLHRKTLRVLRVPFASPTNQKG